MKKIFLIILGILLFGIVFVSAISILDKFGEVDYSNVETSGGNLESGIIEFFGEQEYEIGELIGKELSEEEVLVKDIKFQKEEGKTNLIFTGDSSLANIKGDTFENVDSSKLSKIELNEFGEIESAVLTASEDTSFTFDDEVYKLLKGQKITYKDEKVNIEGEEGETIQFKERDSVDFAEISLLDDSLNFEKDLEGNRVLYGNFKIGDDEILGLNKEELGKVTLSKDGKISKIWENSDVKISGIRHQVSKGDLNLYYNTNFNPSEHSGENYFSYGKDKIYLGGNGFTSKLQQGNEIFPEFSKNEFEFPYDKGKLEFTLKGGSLEIERDSEEGRPLTLKLDGEGSFEIKNGEWFLKSDGEHIYAKRTGEEFTPSDLRIKYNSASRERIYDLDVVRGYVKKLDDQDIKKINKKIENLNSLEQIKTNELNSLLDNQEFQELEGRLNDITKQKDKIIQDYEILLRNDWGNEELIKERDEKLARLDKVYDETESNPFYLKKKALVNKIVDFQEEIANYQDILKNNKIDIVGAFGEVIIEEGNVLVNFNKHTQCSPILKNSQMVKLGGEIFSENIDTNLVPVQGNLQCADVPMYHRFMWEKERLDEGKQHNIAMKLLSREVIEFNSDGSYSVWSEGEKRIIYYPRGDDLDKADLDKRFEKWLDNVFEYANTESLNRDLKRVAKAEEIIAGDIYTVGNTHTGYFKERIRIPPGSDNIYFVRSAGSTDSNSNGIGDRIYKKIWSMDELRELMASEEFSILRWSTLLV